MVIADAVAAHTVVRAAFIGTEAGVYVFSVIRAVHVYLCTRFAARTQAALTATEAPGYSGRGPNETAK